MKKLWKNFGAFITKGNAIDLAIGVVIGTAFNAIVKSLVSDIIMSFISLFVGKDITNWFWAMKATATFDSTTGQYVFSANAVVMQYGNFILAVTNFFLIAIAIFVALKAVIMLKKGIEEAKEAIISRTEKDEPKDALCLVL